MLIVHHLHQLHHPSRRLGQRCCSERAAQTRHSPPHHWCRWCRWCKGLRGRVLGWPWPTTALTKGGAKVVHAGAVDPPRGRDPTPDRVGVRSPSGRRSTRLSNGGDRPGYLAGYNEGAETVIWAIPRQIVPEFRR